MKNFGTAEFEGKTYSITEKPAIISRKGWPGGVGYEAKAVGPDGAVRTVRWKLSIEYLQESHCCHEEESTACDWERADEVE